LALGKIGQLFALLAAGILHSGHVLHVKHQTSRSESPQPRES
jgi:hypothetical protein